LVFRQAIFVGQLLPLLVARPRGCAAGGMTGPLLPSRFVGATLPCVAVGSVFRFVGLREFV